MLLSIGLAITPGLFAQQTDDEEDEEIIELSPFEVDASKDQGYYSERTLAGSRIDMKLSDIAASISVINREQLEDTAATDINEVFLYDLNTEGADTYTETITSFRDGIRDGGSGFSAANTGSLSNYSNANRVRGIGTPDNSRNYYRSIPTMGFDSYNTQSIEINRGPNSLLFGQGSPAGIVNQNTSEAYTDSRKTELQFRLGQYGTYRAHINHNQPVIEDVLGVYVAGLYDSEGFRRKPSYDIERRVYGAVTYKPFKGLKITGSYENFDQSQSRPNTLTPIDAVSPWLNAGRPAYDPISRTVTVQETGQVVGPYFRHATSPYATEGVPVIGNGLNSLTSPFYVPGINFYGRTSFTLIGSRNDYFSIDSRQTGRRNTFSNPNVDDRPPALTDFTPAQWAIYDQDWTRSATEPSLRSEPNADGFTVSNWQPNTVTDSSIYDWTKYNTNAPNYADFDGNTANLEVDYRILDNWYVRVGWFDQNLDTEEHFTLGQVNANRLWVDTNINLPNGDANPFFGQPYVEDSQPDTFLHGFDNSTIRAQTNLELDFTGHDGLVGALGRHNFTGVATRADWDTSQIRTRGTTVAGDPLLLLSTRDPASNTWWQRGERLVRQYYMGSAGVQGQVTHSAPAFGAPSYGGPTENNTLFYSWNNGGFTTLNSTWANALSEAGTVRNRERTDSITLAWTGSLLDERLVTVFGYRHDNIAKQATTGTQGLAATDWIIDGYPQLDVLWANWNEEVQSGNTWTKGFTLDVFRSDDHEISLFYNKSENINPQGGVNVDFYGNPLTEPGGSGQDFGFSFGLFDNKFTTRVTWYEATSFGDTGGPAGSAIDRLGRVDRDYFIPWATTIARIEQGQLPILTDDDTTTDPDALLPLISTPALQNRVEELTGIPYNYYDNLPGNIAATQTNKAQGLEINMTWNPNTNWTFRAAISSQSTAYSEVGPEVDAWLLDRSEWWDNAVSPLSAADNRWLFNNTRATDLTRFWNSYGFVSGVDPATVGAYRNVRQYYDDAVAGLIGFYKAQQGKPVDNQRKWRANFITRYSFTEGLLKGSFVGGGLRWEDKIAIGYMGIVGNPIESPNQLNTADTDRPIYDSANTYFDIWAGYRTKIMNERAELLVQLNVRNLFEDGDLKPVGADFAGNKHTWRIIDPREIFLTTTLKF